MCPQSGQNNPSSISGCVAWFWCLRNCYLQAAGFALIKRNQRRRRDKERRFPPLFLGDYAPKDTAAAPQALQKRPCAGKHLQTKKPSQNRRERGIAPQKASPGIAAWFDGREGFGIPRSTAALKYICLCPFVFYHLCLTVNIKLKVKT